MSEEIHVNGKVLRWAREEAEMSLEDATRKLNFTF